MKIHVMQHVPYEGPGTILQWAKQKGHDVAFTQFFEPGWSLPAPGNVDLLVVLGGPMGVHDDAAYPWLATEKSFIRDYIDSGRPMLGICLGAQLAADALGAKVYPNEHKEIGWFPIQKTSLPHPILFDMADGQMVFHWHSDTFDLPEGALHLAKSEACANQAFIWKEQVMGLQFHMEMTAEDVEALSNNCFQDMKGNHPYVQSDAQIQQGLPHTEFLGPLFYSILTRFATT
jgi:GMP synthase-like glutamine amidotransferase